MPKADACSTTISLLGLPAHAEAPEPEQSEPPRRSLRGYRCAYESEPGSGSGLDEDTATPAERARFRRDQARQLLAMARDKVRLAYAATGRFRRDRRWGGRRRGGEGGAVRGRPLPQGARGALGPRRRRPRLRRAAACGARVADR